MALCKWPTRATRNTISYFITQLAKDATYMPGFFIALAPTTCEQSQISPLMKSRTPLLVDCQQDCSTITCRVTNATEVSGHVQFQLFNILQPWKVHDSMHFSRRLKDLQRFCFSVFHPTLWGFLHQGVKLPMTARPWRQKFGTAPGLPSRWLLAVDTQQKRQGLPK